MKELRFLKKLKDAVHSKLTCYKRQVIMNLECHCQHRNLNERDIKCYESDFTDRYLYGCSFCYYDHLVFWQNDIEMQISNLVISKNVKFTLKDTELLLEYYKNIRCVCLSFECGTITSTELNDALSMLFSSKISFLDDYIFEQSKDRFQSLDVNIKILQVAIWEYTDEDKYLAYHNGLDKKRVKKRHDFLSQFFN